MGSAMCKTNTSASGDSESPGNANAASEATRSAREKDRLQSSLSEERHGPSGVTPSVSRTTTVDDEQTSSDQLMRGGHHPLQSGEPVPRVAWGVSSASRTPGTPRSHGGSCTNDQMVTHLVPFDSSVTSKSSFGTPTPGGSAGADLSMAGALQAPAGSSKGGRLRSNSPSIGVSEPDPEIGFAPMSIETSLECSGRRSDSLPTSHSGSATVVQQATAVQPMLHYPLH